MITKPYNEAASAKAPMMQAAANALAAERAAHVAELDFPWDITSPEGLIAFFGEKLKSTNTDLKNLMRAQQDRSKIIKDVGLMIGMLAADKDMKPGSPEWGEFQRLAALVGPSLGASDDANAIRATLEQANKPAFAVDTFDAENEGGRAEFTKTHPNATYQYDLNSNKVILTSELDPPGLDAAGAKTLGAKLKSLNENMQSDNQMDAIRVQELVGRISQIMSLASNILHKFHEGAMTPIANTK